MDILTFFCLVLLPSKLSQVSRRRTRDLQFKTRTLFRYICMERFVIFGIKGLITIPTPSAFVLPGRKLNGEPVFNPRTIRTSLCQWYRRDWNSSSPAAIAFADARFFFYSCTIENERTHTRIRRKEIRRERGFGFPRSFVLFVISHLPIIAERKTLWVTRREELTRSARAVASYSLQLLYRISERKPIYKNRFRIFFRTVIRMREHGNFVFKSWRVCLTLSSSSLRK